MSPGMYRTSDMCLCAYLMMLDVQVVEITKVDDWRAEMVFADGDVLRHAVMDYETDKAVVEPKAFKRFHDDARRKLMEAVGTDSGYSAA